MAISCDRAGVARRTPAEAAMQASHVLVVRIIEDVPRRESVVPGSAVGTAGQAWADGVTDVPPMDLRQPCAKAG